MSASALLLGFLNVLLYCAVIILVAFVILWVLRYFGIQPDGEVLKWGKIVVALLCIIAIAAWLFSLLGGAGTYQPHFLWRW
jgi:hypothetical protein